MKQSTTRLLSFILCALLLLGLSPVSLAETAQSKLIIEEESSLPQPLEQGLSFYVMPLLGADCMLVVCDGQTMLVDMGKRNDYPVIQDTLNRLGIQRIDIALNTHPHSDHIGSMALIAQDYPVGRFITTFSPTLTGPSILQVSTLRELKRLSVPVERLKDGDSFELGSAQITLMKTNHTKINGASTVVHISYQETSLLLAADINRAAQNRLAQTYGAALKADVLKYPHHGQDTLNEGFSEFVSPIFSVITHGSANSKPGQGWLDRYGIPFQLATWGVISLQSDGQSLRVYQELSEESRAIKERWEQRR